MGTWRSSPPGRVNLHAASQTRGSWSYWPRDPGAGEQLSGPDWRSTGPYRSSEQEDLRGTGGQVTLYIVDCVMSNRGWGASGPSALPLSSLGKKHPHPQPPDPVKNEDAQIPRVLGGT